MKDTLTFWLLVAMTIGCIYFNWKWVSHDNTPVQVTVGPNQTYFWTESNTINPDGVYSLKSSQYFEVHQGDTIKQAIYKNPEVGETSGVYWIRDYLMTGSWAIRIDYRAEIFSLEASTFISTPNKSTVTSNIAVGFLGGFVLWLVGIYLIKWLYDKFP